MDAARHWDEIYRAKTPVETSWYAPHLQTSFDWICEAAPDRSSPILDVGGGESTLVDDLLHLGYRNLTVLDLSPAALQKSQARVGDDAKFVHWLAGDVTEVSLSPQAFALWHDRAVFHFLIAPEQRAAYVLQLAASLKPRGSVILATFGPDGPERCSGLPVQRYSAQSLQQELGPEFQLERSATLDHQTPFGTTQQFLYCRFLFG